MVTNIKVLWDLVWENIDSPQFKLLIIIALITSIGSTIVSIHISNQDYKARRIESDNLLKIELAKSESEYSIRKYESDNLLKIELAKLEWNMKTNPP
jgi:hypothetical protein